MGGMHATWREHRNGLHLSLFQERVDVVECRNTKLDCECISAFWDFVADGNELGSGDMASPKKIGMALRNTSAAQQAEFDHCTPLWFLVSEPDPDHDPARFQIPNRNQVRLSD